MNRFFQQGTALIYTMVFLTIMAFAGVTSVQFASLEQKMAASFRARQAAFVAAESVLQEAERCVKGDSRCSDLAAFDSSCTNGLCFSGSDRTSVVACRTGIREHWQEGAYWRDSGKTIESRELPAESGQGQYMIEFLCYVPRTLFGVTPNPANPGDWAKLFRITALATVKGRNSKVMLQSTYKR